MVRCFACVSKAPFSCTHASVTHWRGNVSCRRNLTAETVRQKPNSGSLEVANQTFLGQEHRHQTGAAELPRVRSIIRMNLLVARYLEETNRITLEQYDKKYIEYNGNSSRSLMSVMSLTCHQSCSRP
jgi:hypothetical protein